MIYAEMGRRLEELERPKAEEREKAGRPSGNLPEGGKGDTRDIVGEALGVSGKTYEKAKAIEAIENPEAASRRRATQNNASANSSSGNLPEQASCGDTRDKVGKALGVSGKGVRFAA